MRRYFGQFALVERLLLVAERAVALLSRCQPRNASAEQQRLKKIWRRGDVDRPFFTYEVVPELKALRDSLAHAERRMSQRGPVGRLYGERSRELFLETEMVEAIGTGELASRAERRFRRGDEAEAEALEVARVWCELTPRSDTERTASSDRNEPNSLVRRMQAKIGELRLPVRVELCATMSAAAATGDGVILIAPERSLTRAEVERIVLHEVLGHALPRYRASREALKLFALGSARGNDEQEGYALYIEEQHGYLDDGRKRELGLRHVAAVSVHDGADWIETTRMLQCIGASIDEAIAVASRVHRAGGLAREFVYLPALIRVKRAVGTDPELMAWLGRGRLSLSAIGELRVEELQRVTAR